jgi:putative membrane protein
LSDGRFTVLLKLNGNKHVLSLNQSINMKKINLLLATVAIGTFLQACSGSKTASTSDSTSIKTDSNTTTVKTDSSAVLPDTIFAAKAAVGGMAEVALGKMAEAKGTDGQVKDFGKMMVTDHGKANAELMSIAKAKNLSLPSGLDAEHQAKSDSLSKLSGKDFDEAYVNAMVEGHQKTLALMQSEASNGKDADLKAFAAKTAPVVQMHLTAINKIKGSLK